MSDKAAEAIARARAIAARLSGQAPPTINYAAPSSASDDGMGERKSKRKRWAKDESTTAESAGYRSMALPADVLAAAAMAAASSNNNYQDDQDSSILSGMMAASTVPTTSSTSTYTPKPVAQILGLSTGTYGSSDPNSALVAYQGSAYACEEVMYVPNGIVGFIIGRGGENITSMQRKTLCKVQIQKESEMHSDPAHTNKQERKITLLGPDTSAISECRQIIENMVAERRQQLGPKSMDPAEDKFRAALAQGHAHLQIQIPDKDVGLVIGRQGTNMKQIQDATNAHVHIPSAADASNPAVRTCNITCITIEGAQQAQQMIQEILNKHAMFLGPNSGGGSYGNTPGLGSQTSISVAIPDKDVGIVIGRGGCVIKEMQNKTGCRIQIPSQPTPGQVNRIATITGTEDGCQQVSQMIERIIIDQSSAGVMSGSGGFNRGGGAQGYGQQYGQAAYAAYGQASYDSYGQAPAAATSAYGQAAITTTGEQTDYSAEWAAYYAAQALAGTTMEATAVAVAPATTAVTAAPAQAAVEKDLSDPTAYYDDFWRYAAYYGEAAAREYYKAWSPPEGTPNPNLATAAVPVAVVATPAPAPSHIPVQLADAKETSARKVSNLPAWMTKQQS